LSHTRKDHRKAGVLGITESDLGPLARHSDVLLKVKEGSASGLLGRSNDGYIEVVNVEHLL
jgi:D-arabinose 5-phosphate isomerase GutQ